MLLNDSLLFRSPFYHLVFLYLSNYKKFRIKNGGDWQDVTMLKYIEERVLKLNV